MDPLNGRVDVKRLIGEVAARHNILLKEDDAAFALVTMNQLVLEGVAAEILAKVEERLAGKSFDVDALAAQVAEKLKGGHADAAPDNLGVAGSHFARSIQEAGERALRLADEFGRRFRWTLITVSTLCFAAGAMAGASVLWFFWHR